MGGVMLPQGCHDSKADKILGVILSLVAGALFGVMFAPMPYWEHRLVAAGCHPRAFDFVFAVCVGCALTSTLWLLFWSTVKKLQHKRLEKSVLRPALLAGAIY